MSRTASSHLGPVAETDMDGDTHYGSDAGLIFGPKRPVTAHTDDYLNVVGTWAREA